jgi:hypothetical protein
VIGRRNKNVRTGQLDLLYKPPRRPLDPGARGWTAPGGGSSTYVQAPPRWRGTTIQVCGLWPFAAGSGAPMIGVPLGRALRAGSDDDLLRPHQLVHACQADPQPVRHDPRQAGTREVDRRTPHGPRLGRFRRSAAHPRRPQTRLPRPDRRTRRPGHRPRPGPRAPERTRSRRSDGRGGTPHRVTADLADLRRSPAPCQHHQRTHHDSARR